MGEPSARQAVDLESIVRCADGYLTRTELLDEGLPELLQETTDDQKALLCQAFATLGDELGDQASVIDPELEPTLYRAFGAFSNHQMTLLDTSMAIPEHEDPGPLQEALAAGGIDQKELHAFFNTLHTSEAREVLMDAIVSNPDLAEMARTMKLTADDDDEEEPDGDGEEQEVDPFAGLSIPVVPLNASLGTDYMLRKKMQFFQRLLRAKVYIRDYDEYVVFKHHQAIYFANLWFDYVDISAMYQARDVFNFFRGSKSSNRELKGVMRKNAAECDRFGCEPIKRLWKTFPGDLTAVGAANKAITESDLVMSALQHVDAIYAVVQAINDGDLTVWTMLAHYKISHAEIPDTKFAVIKAILRMGFNNTLSEESIEEHLRAVVLYDKIRSASDALCIMQPFGSHAKLMSQGILHAMGSLRVFKKTCGRILNTIDVVGEKALPLIRGRKPGQPLPMPKLPTGKRSKTKVYFGLEDIQIAVVTFKPFGRSERADPYDVPEFTDAEEEDDAEGQEYASDEEGDADAEMGEDNS